MPIKYHNAVDVRNGEVVGVPEGSSFKVTTHKDRWGETAGTVEAVKGNVNLNDPGHTG